MREILKKLNYFNQKDIMVGEMKEEEQEREEEKTKRR